MTDRLLTVDDAMKASLPQIRQWHQHANPAAMRLLGLVGFDREWVKAQGATIWDRDGNEVLDFYGGYGTLNVGHNHPKVIEAVNKVASMPNMLAVTLSPTAGALAKNLATITPGELSNCYFCCTGTEAIEAAIKLACAATGKKGVICSTVGAFHGKTLGSLSISGKDFYKNGFPLLREVALVPYGDAQSLEDRLSRGDVAAFVVEPIQGEAGVIVPPQGYLKDVRRLCDKYGVLFIADEIQTGFGRTGSMFACEHEGVAPDVMALAKSLGGGVMPIGAMIATRKLWDKAYGSLNKAAMHTSTFGGNTRATAAGIAAINVIYDEGLPERARELGEYLLGRLKEVEAKHKLIKEVRGRGLMIGIEFYAPSGGKIGALDKLSKEYLASMIAAELLREHRVLTAYTWNNPNVIRFAPPLIVSKEQCDWAVDALDKTCERNKGFMRTVLRGGASLLKK